MSRITAKHLSIVSGTLLTVLAVGWWLWEFAPAARDADAPAPAVTAAAPTGAVPADPPRVRRTKKADASERKRTSDDPASIHDPPPASAALTVRVVAAATHEAVSGAVVEVTDADCDGWECDCGPDGVARFESIPAGATEIHARTAETMEASRTVVLAANAKETVEIALDPAAAIEGIVVDAKDGAPVASADLEAIAKGDGGDRRLEDAATDDAGRFRFAQMPTGTVVVLRAMHAGFTRGEASVVVPAAGGSTVRAELRLHRTGTVRGTVRTPDGVPTPGPTVRVAAEADGAGPCFGKCGPGGAYVVREVPTGVRLVATAEADGWASSAPEAVLLTDAAPDASLDLQMRRPATIVLRVTDPDGRPVTSAWASFDGAEGSAHGAPDGIVRREGLAPGRHSVEVDARGLRTATRDVVVNEGETVTVDVALDRGGAIWGTVVNRRGEPVAGVYVFAAPEPPPGAARPNRHDFSEGAMTDGRGAFCVTGIVSGRYELFVFATRDAGLVGHENDAARGSAAEGSSAVRLVVDVDVTAKLRVVLPAGATRSADVLVAQVFPEHPGMNAPVGDGVALAIDYDAWTRDGVIRCGIAPRSSWLRVRVPGFAPDMVLVPPAELGTTLDLGEMRIHAGLTLRGRVVDSAGHAVGGAAVSTSADDRTAPRVVSASDGTFAVGHLGPGEVVVRAETESRFGAVVLRSADDPGGATIVVRRGGLVRGVVVDGVGAPVRRASISIRHGTAGGYDSGREASATSDDTGAFTATVAAGACRGVVTVGGNTYPFAADVPEGGEATVRVETK